MWNTNYWHTNYWHLDYWAEDVTVPVVDTDVGTPNLVGNLIFGLVGRLIQSLTGGLV